MAQRFDRSIRELRKAPLKHRIRSPFDGLQVSGARCVTSPVPLMLSPSTPERGVLQRVATALLPVAAMLTLMGCRSDVAPAPTSPATAPPPPSRNALLREAIDAVQSAQRDGDVEQHQRADRLADALIDRFGADSAALTLRATARAGLHRFAEALAATDAAIALNPYDPAPYAVRVDALVELGDYERAVDTAQALLKMKPSHAAYARAAYLRLLYGDPSGAVRLMRLAVDATPANATNERAWYLGQLGRDALAVGDSATAQRAFTEVLALFPDDASAREGLAALAAARGDTPRAVTLYQQVIAEGPAPDAHAALADIYLSEGRAADAAPHLAAAERAERAELEGPGTPERRHLVLLWADHGLNPAETLRMAETDADERDDLFTDDTLAWALYQNGRIDEARAHSARALRLGTRDPLLRYHAGVIAAAAGADEEAAHHLEIALVGAAVLGPRRSAEARRWLERAQLPAVDQVTYR